MTWPRFQVGLFAVSDESVIDYEDRRGHVPGCTASLPEDAGD